MTVYMVYVTTGSRSEAAKIAMALVEEKLAACVNIFPEIESIYEWEGRVRTDTECAFIAKTTEDRLAEVIDRVRSRHSYDCPCIVALPIDHGHPDFLNWVRDQTRPPLPVQPT